ncbi:MAG: VTT domain-containing protein [Halanaeroarchaeum sp.]
MSVALSLHSLGFSALEAAVRAASGWSGVFVIFVYSLLIAFVLPLPSEVVLCPVGYICADNSLALGLPIEVQVVVVILASALGKAIGSVFALAIGHNAARSDIVIWALRRLGLQPMEWSKRQMVGLAQRWGYLGMAVGLSIPFFPDTVSLYAFAILEDDYRKFALAAFAGSVGRLLVAIATIEGVTALF